MALGDGAWTPYPRTLFPDLYPWTLDPFPNTPPQTHGSEPCVWDGTPSPSHRQVSLFKDVCSKTLAIVVGSSHF